MQTWLGGLRKRVREVHNGTATGKKRNQAGKRISRGSCKEKHAREKGRSQNTAYQIEMKKKRSILSKDWDVCYFGQHHAECTHHVFGGSRKKASEREGFIVRLCNRCHNMSDESVHFNKERDLLLKRICQREYEKTHTREEFIDVFGRSYLE